ncbi:hypothetical protein AB0I81_22530 [Nonomuraea sp. NPDC050404]|uniref:hypothetical protein n=1 Tax=Nonomuraea sp. NPDC050404 TaxID=3155783 RepID=UPI0033CFEB2E
MTREEVVRRLREMADKPPTYITHAVLRLAQDLEQGPWPLPETVPVADLEALVRATQPPTRRPGLIGALLRRLG